MRAGISLTRATRQTRRRGKGRNTRNQAVMAINGNVPRAPLAPKLPSSLLLRAGSLFVCDVPSVCLPTFSLRQKHVRRSLQSTRTHKKSKALSRPHKDTTDSSLARQYTDYTNAQVQCRCPYLTCLLRVCCAVDQAARAVGTVVRRKGRVIRRSCR